MFTSLRRAAVVGLLASSLVAVPIGIAATASGGPAVAATTTGARAETSRLTGATTITPAQAALAGAGYVARLVTSSGDIVTSTGSPDPSSTANAVLALAATRVGSRQAQAAIKWLEGHFESYVVVSGADDPGRLATLILAANALRVDPFRFGGTKAPNDLVARLLATQRHTGRDAGLFGSADPTYDGTYRQGLAILALAAVGERNLAGIWWLRRQQCTDGGWTSYRANIAVPCPAPDPSTFAGPDTNSTSLAVQALVASSLVVYGPHFRYNPAPFFVAAEEPQGSFGFIGIAGHGQAGDADSTALSVQALAALRILYNPEYRKVGGTPMAALVRFQIGCAAPVRSRGAFVFQHTASTPSPNLYATLQAVPAVAGMPFPIGAAPMSTAEPQLSC